jgi:hypothetical protein
MKITIATLLLCFTSVFVFGAEESSESGWQPKRSVIESWNKRRAAGLNFDESRVPKYQLPDPLVLNDGRPVKTRHEWTTKRRPELLQMFRENIYGIRPTTKYKVEYKEVGRRENVFGIGATARQIRATVRARGKSHSFDFVMVVPQSKAPVPLIVHINNRYLIPLDKAVEKFDPFWPVEKIVRRGYATVGFHTSHVDPDKRDGYTEGIRAMLEDPESDPETRWGCLSAWAWGASRVLDFAIKQPGIDPRRTAVAGNSRAGKTALWAGAEDERFRIVYSNESGCGGAALFRRVFGETIAQINRRLSYWFCKRFNSYNGRENALPVDQHELIALTVPRAVYIASADEDLWADPRGEYASLIESGPVFELFSLKHVTIPAMPALNKPRHVGSTGYHIRTGVHSLTEKDWGYFLDFADGVFEK